MCSAHGHSHCLAGSDALLIGGLFSLVYFNKRLLCCDSGSFLSPLSYLSVSRPVISHVVIFARPFFFSSSRLTLSLPLSPSCFLSIVSLTLA